MRKETLNNSHIKLRQANIQNRANKVFLDQLFINISETLQYIERNDDFSGTKADDVVVSDLKRLLESISWRRF
jgi:hypothetical protein